MRPIGELLTNKKNHYKGVQKEDNQKTSISISSRSYINSNTSNRVTGKDREQIKQIADYLNKILKPKDNALRLFLKFAWLYDDTTLIRLANEAKETDRQNSPCRLFVYLVKKELGYEKNSH